jgi:hypothetical protein
MYSADFLRLWYWIYIHTHIIPFFLHMLI